MNSFVAAFAVLSSLSVSGLAQAASVQVPAGDCAAINAAIQALPAHGGVVRLAAGTYICNDPVVLNRDGVTLNGAGRALDGALLTVLKAADNRPMPVLIIGEPKAEKKATEKWGDQFYPIRETRYVNVNHLRIDGNMHSSKEPGKYECYKVATKESLSCDGDGGEHIRNNGITIRRASHVRIQDVDTVANYSGGIVTEKGCSDLVINGFSSSDNYFDGFACYETEGSTFMNFRNRPDPVSGISKNHYSGISVDMGCEHNRFISGELNNNGDNGVFSQKVGYNVYEGLTMLGNGNFGYYFESGRAWDGSSVPGTCDGNQVLKNDLTLNRRAVNVNGSSCKGVVIKDSVFRTKADQCTWFNTGAEVRVENVLCEKF